MDTTADQCFTGHSPQSLHGYKLDVGGCNGDGYDDLVVGAPWHPNGEEIGRAYLYYGPFEHTRDITFTWETTNASIGKHTLRIEISPVEGEENTADNVQTVPIDVKAPSKQPGFSLCTLRTNGFAIRDLATCV